jgi:hypothetical protein
MKVKFSVLVNPKNNIVAAFIPSRATPEAGPHASDGLRPGDGNKIHEVVMPPELAAETLSGNFGEALKHYKFVNDGGKPALKRIR